MKARRPWEGRETAASVDFATKNPDMMVEEAAPGAAF